MVTRGIQHSPAGLRQSKIGVEMLEVASALSTFSGAIGVEFLNFEGSLRCVKMTIVFRLYKQRREL